MIVADASVLVEMLLVADGPAGAALARRFSRRETVCAPHLLDAEVGQVLRRFALRGEISAHRARASLDDLSVLPIRRFPHARLLTRAFELRSNVTIYDGIYLALAEALGAQLLSCDAALAEVPGCAATVNLLPVSPIQPRGHRRGGDVSGEPAGRPDQGAAPG